MTDRPRVLRVIARMNVGGPALHVTLLHEGLRSAGFDTLLATGSLAPGEADYLELHGRVLGDMVRVPALCRAVRPHRDAVALAQLAMLIRRFRPHIVHTHTAKAGTLGRIAAFLTRVPVVVHTYHGHVFSGYFSRRSTSAVLAVERALARRTTRLLAVSQAVKRDLLAHGIGTPSRVIEMPLGLDLAPFVGAEVHRGMLRQELGVAADTPLIGIVARLVPIKAHEVFLDAARRLVDAGSCARFVIVGDGERRAELMTHVAELGLTDRVTFLGWRADLPSVYADLDLVTLTSQNEGTPVSLIEAMAAGRPVIATAVGGVPDVVQHETSGLLVPVGDARSLAAAIERLLMDRIRAARLAAEGRRRVLARFDVGRLILDMQRLYDELLAERSLAFR